jgi:hypothetical protein
MKRNFLIVLSLSVAVLAAAFPVFAHHSISAEFDSTKPIKFEGVVKGVDWMNPHIYVNIEAVENGKTVLYSVEGGPPNSLYRQGWRADSLKVGDKVSVSGIRAKKADSNRIGTAQITMPDGRIFARGSANAANQ